MTQATDPQIEAALLALIVAFAYIIFRVFQSIWSEKEFEKEEILSWETNPDVLSYEKLEELLAGFLEAGNYPQALRILFLLVLKELCHEFTLF